MKGCLKRFLIGLGIIVLLLAAFVYRYFFSMRTLPTGEWIRSFDSPAGTYTIDAYLVDPPLSASALRCQVTDHNTGKSRNIYWSYREWGLEVTWINEYTVDINGKILDVRSDHYDWRRDKNRVEGEAVLSVDAAQEIAAPYFAAQHGVSVQVESTSLYQTGEHSGLQEVRVSDGTQSYTLMLDQRNRPVCDNFDAVVQCQVLAETYAESISEVFAGAEVEDISFLPLLSSSNSRFIITLQESQRSLPQPELAAPLWELLQSLHTDGVDSLVLSINSPDFLRPAVYGIQLRAEWFDSSLDAASFAALYDAYVQSIWWDEAAFDAALAELAQYGCQNARFCLTGFKDGKTLQIALTGDAGPGYQADAVDAFLAGMGAQYLRCEGTIFEFQNKITPSASNQP